ncbi:sodium:calcium antiporter [Blastopirellula marina]|uniref:Sodium:calcium antiporter n=1 Tax=Blastopirellula marina TaxID=124 RepID=A0A2S8F193_9BACT|nr:MULTISPECIES: calcium/sodium antiporter [Pirellulaceae]PQO25903.1 sodium:calcium antiporter [Blastopirellula marina]RCS44261.1 sodium:calcium antiporter [Bremerella cremea]
MLLAVGLILVGLVALVLGGELLVRGASALAAFLGVSPLIIGLTVVAFGTSAPELAVSLKAGLTGQADISVGNVVGSNIFNILFILGISALVAPLVVHSQLIRRELPLMVIVSLVTWGLAFNGTLGRIEGLVLVAGLVVYVIWSVIESRRESAAVVEEFAEEFDKPPRTKWGLALQLLWIVLGLIALAVGSRWLVDGAVMIARQMGMSELLIGLTIVAVGTSLPEVVASIAASLKGERDIAVGNVVGSNLFNLMCVLGMTAVIVPDGVPVASSAVWQEIPVMIAASAICLPIFFTGYRIDRWEGGLFLAWYVLYTVYLVLVAIESPLASTVGVVALFGGVPLTVLILLASLAFARSSGPEMPDE